MKQGTIKFGTLRVGTVSEITAEWSWFNGAIVLDQAFLDSSSEIYRRLREYRELTIREDILSRTQTDNDCKELDLIYDKEGEFEDIIESEEWTLISEGKARVIACPSFGQDNMIYWR